MFFFGRSVYSVMMFTATFLLSMGNKSRRNSTRVFLVRRRVEVKASGSEVDHLI